MYRELFLPPIYRDQKVAVQTALINRGPDGIENALNNISWTSDAVTSLQSSVVNGPVLDICVTNAFVS